MSGQKYFSTEDVLASMKSSSKSESDSSDTKNEYQPKLSDFEQSSSADKHLRD